MPGNLKLSPETFFGIEAARAWRAVIDAAHQFAQLTDCLPGDDVFLWHEVKSEQFHKAVEADIPPGAPASTTPDTVTEKVAATRQQEPREAINPPSQTGEPEPVADSPWKLNRDVLAYRVANARQGQSSTPRCEEPGQADIDTAEGRDMSTPDEIDVQWERDKRERRWVALKEDGEMFGLTPGEAAEYARLDAEFAPTKET